MKNLPYKEIPYEEARDFDLASAVFDMVFQRYKDSRASEVSQLPPLVAWLGSHASEFERDLVSVLAFTGQMYNGGIEQALGNSGDLAPGVIDALTKLGHQVAADALREIVSVWCPSGVVSGDDDERWEALSKISEAAARGGKSCEDVYQIIESIDTPSGDSLHDQYGALIRQRRDEYTPELLQPHLKRLAL